MSDRAEQFEAAFVMMYGDPSWIVPVERFPDVAHLHVSHVVLYRERRTARRTADA